MTEEDKLKERANEIVDAKTPEAKPKDESPDAESPLEEARRLNRELKETANILNKERELLERHRAEMQLAGKGYAGARPKTQEELDQEEAQKIVDNYTK